MRISRATGLLATASVGLLTAGLLTSPASAVQPSEAQPDQVRRVTIESVTPAANGGSYLRMQRTINGVPLLGGDIAVQLGANGRVKARLSKDTTDQSVDMTARISAQQAAAIALQATARETHVGSAALTASTPEQWIYDPRIFDAPGIPQARLVWQVEVTSPTHPDVRQLVLVGAATGDIALSLNAINSALDRLTCDAAKTSGRSPCTAPLNVAAGERGETDPPSVIDDVNIAHEFTGDAYDFFFRLFNRDSIDGEGMQLLSTVRFRPEGAQDTNYKNAFWNGTQMHYGEGMVAQDVVAHELMHGVTEHRSPLYYYTQSGAINESLSDIFGEYIDLTYPGGNDSDEVRWQIGEDIATVFGFTLRSMKDPTLSQHPDRTGSPFFRPLDEDQGGVHRNSGVGNKFAYLIADGDTFNGQTVRGIGIEKAAQVVYGAMPMLTSAADYQMLAKALRASCATLIGSHGITDDDCAQVHKAILATEMDIEPHNGRVAPAPICAAGKPVALWAEDFEDDTLTWEKTGTESLWFRTGDPTPYDFPADSYAVSGTHNIWGDGPDVLADGSLAMAEPITVPEGKVYLRFAHAFEFQREAGGRWDGGVLEYTTGDTWLDAGPLIVNNGYTGELSGFGSDNPLKGRDAFVEASRGYITTRLDLSSLAGESVRFRFRIATNSSVGSAGWFIDDMHMYACPQAPRIRALESTRRSIAVAANVPNAAGAPVTDVEYRLNSGTWRSTGQTTGNFTIAGLRPGRSYWVEVRTINGTGRSAASDAVRKSTRT